MAISDVEKKEAGRKLIGPKQNKAFVAFVCFPRWYTYGDIIVCRFELGGRRFMSGRLIKSVPFLMIYSLRVLVLFIN